MRAALTDILIVINCPNMSLFNSFDLILKTLKTYFLNTDAYRYKKF